MILKNPLEVAVEERYYHLYFSRSGGDLRERQAPAGYSGIV